MPHEHLVRVPWESHPRIPGLFLGFVDGKRQVIGDALSPEIGRHIVDLHNEWLGEQEVHGEFTTDPRRVHQVLHLQSAITAINRAIDALTADKPVSVPELLSSAAGSIGEILEEVIDETDPLPAQESEGVIAVASELAALDETA